MKIKLLQQICGPLGVFNAGSIEDVPDGFGEALIACGVAFLAEPEAQAADAPQSLASSNSQREVADAQPGRRKRAAATRGA